MVTAILSVIYSLNKYFKFLSDKLPFTSTLTGMPEFNHFSTKGLQNQLKFYFRSEKNLDFLSTQKEAKSAKKGIVAPVKVALDFTLP